MAQHYSGVNGRAKFGTSNTLGITGWTATRTQRMVETNSSRTSPAVTEETGFYQWSGTVSLQYDSDGVDWTTANTPMLSGNKAKLLLAITSLTGPGFVIDNARIIDQTWGVDINGGVTCSCNWRSTGTVTGWVADVSA